MGNSIGNLPMLRMPPSGLGAVRSSLNPNDPDYLHKMGLIGSIEGAHELEQANQDIASQERARAQMDLGGEGVTTGPVTHALGMPADPEAPTLIKPRTLLGKIGHGLAEAGNIAGESVFPGQMAMIPGTDLYKRATVERQFEHGLESERQQELEQREQEMAKLGEGRLGVQQQGEATKESQGAQKLGQGQEGLDLKAKQEAATELFHQQQLAMEQGIANMRDATSREEFAQRADLLGKQLLERIQHDRSSEATAEERAATEQDAMRYLANYHYLGAQLGIGKMDTVTAEIENALFGAGPLARTEGPIVAAGKPSGQQPVQPPPAAPKVGETKKFPNGKVGKWDGHGWVAQ